jgi:hypothetical protein
MIQLGSATVSLQFSAADSFTTAPRVPRQAFKELLLMKIDYLPLQSIELLALTLYKATTSVCLTYLEPLFNRRRQAKRMASCFGDYGFESSVTKEQLSESGMAWAFPPLPRSLKRLIMMS